MMNRSKMCHALYLFATETLFYRVPDTSSNGHFLNKTLPQSDTSPIEELFILEKCLSGEMSGSTFSLYSMWKRRDKLFFNQVPSPRDISEAPLKHHITDFSRSPYDNQLIKCVHDTNKVTSLTKWTPESKRRPFYDLEISSR